MDMYLLVSGKTGTSDKVDKMAHFQNYGLGLEFGFEVWVNLTQFCHFCLFIICAIIIPVPFLPKILFIL